MSETPRTDAARRPFANELADKVIEERVKELDHLLAKAIAKRVAERDAARHQLTTALCALEHVRAERDAALADAERYRWLKERKAYQVPEVGSRSVVYWSLYNHPMLIGDTLDAAIDAARGEKG